MGSGHGAQGGISGTLILAAVPIGRPEDASARLVAELARADVVAAEDTRRVRRLAADLGVAITGRVVSYYDVVEVRRAEELVAELQAGKDVLVVTDAGMPGVSDPGYRVVTAAVAAGIAVTAIPGPSALTTALAVSGLPTDRFCFEGFPPRKPGERQARFAELACDPRTQVFFESPRRLHLTLKELTQSHGTQRPAVICRGAHQGARGGRSRDVGRASAVGGPGRAGPEGVGWRTGRDHPCRGRHWPCGRQSCRP